MHTTSFPFNFLKVALGLLIAISSFVVGLAAFVFSYQVNYEEVIYPGVNMGWADLSGMRPEEAVSLLADQFDYPERGRILIRYGENIWTTSPIEVGLFLGPEHNAIRAYQVGRTGALFTRVSDQFQAWYRGINLNPEMVFDERVAERYLGALAAQVERPTIEASLKIDGIDVIARPGQIGRNVDIPATIDLLGGQVGTLLDGEITLVVYETPPKIMDVTQQAELARAILSDQLVLNFPGSGGGGPGPWVFKQEQLAEMLTIELVTTEEGESYQVGLNTDEIRVFLDELAPDLARNKQNARFIFNDDTSELDLLQPSVTGQALDVDATIQAINQKLIEGEHRVRLDMEYTQPGAGDDATAAELGITAMVSAHTSYFYGSSSSRIQNISTASSRFHGVLVAPGETFSMADILGDVSLDTGYAEAWIIFGDRTIKGVGGGVCQVSTTLFRTVFFGGFPVEQRYPHAYRVYYYEQTASGGVDTNLAGLDATVYVPLVDFKFTNDTPNWLLMETYVNEAGRSLTWKFYSTADGRTIEWETSGLTNKQDPPEPLYQENPELKKGEIKQVDWAIDGADVTVTRFVWRDGQIIIDDVFGTHYMPWRAVCEYGPGTKGMPPNKPDPDNPCKPNQ